MFCSKCCFFLSFCIIDFFLQISLFNIWFIEDCVSRFFYAWCFRSNDSSHEFKKLTHVDIFFFLFDFIVWHYLKKNYLCDFFQFLFYQIISMSWHGPWVMQINLGRLASYYLGYMSITLFQVELSQFCFLFLFNFILPYFFFQVIMIGFFISLLLSLFFIVWLK